jgi:hypothetical protein
MIVITSGDHENFISCSGIIICTRAHLGALIDNCNAIFLIHLVHALHIVVSWVLIIVLS